MATGDGPIVDIDRNTGELIQGWPRCYQSIQVILTTRLNTRLMRLWFGSDFLNAVDKPNNGPVYNASILAALHAINKYEPEFRANRVLLNGTPTAGEVEVTIEGVYLPDETIKIVKTILS
jgi:phage baseplate assembly protein W